MHHWAQNYPPQLVQRLFRRVITADDEIWWCPEWMMLDQMGFVEKRWSGWKAMVMGGLGKRMCCVRLLLKPVQRRVSSQSQSIISRQKTDQYFGKIDPVERFLHTYPIQAWMSRIVRDTWLGTDAGDLKYDRQSWFPLWIVTSWNNVQKPLMNDGVKHFSYPWTLTKPILSVSGSLSLYAFARERNKTILMDRDVFMAVTDWYPAPLLIIKAKNCKAKWYSIGADLRRTRRVPIGHWGAWPSWATRLNRPNAQ
jgi:hypothetical protein